MRGFTKVCLVWAAIAVVAAPVQVRADGYVTPWIGGNALTDTDEGRRALGVTSGYMGAGIFGFEFDFGYAPDLFGPTDGLVKTTAITMMGDAILGVPIGGTHGAGIRPFVSGGVGLLRTARESVTFADVSRSNNDFCYDLGGGMMGFFGDHIGLRGDVRYFRTLEDTILGSSFDFSPGRLRFWRVSGGVTFR